MAIYTCSKCGLVAIVAKNDNSDVRVVTTCLCNAPVIADIAADMAGTGGM